MSAGDRQPVPEDCDSLCLCASVLWSLAPEPLPAPPKLRPSIEILAGSHAGHFLTRFASSRRDLDPTVRMAKRFQELRFGLRIAQPMAVGEHAFFTATDS